MSTAEMDARMSPIVEMLVAKSNGKYDAEFLRILVSNVANEFEGARVQDYLEVLVAKQAGDELRKLGALQQVTQ
jgi:hypothetical protein